MAMEHLNSKTWDIARWNYWRLPLLPIDVVAVAVAVVVVVVVVVACILFPVSCFQNLGAYQSFIHEKCWSCVCQSWTASTASSFTAQNEWEYIAVDNLVRL